ncbi:MAG: amidohydrolase family protein, partial [Acidobacteriota bacterium]
DKRYSRRQAIKSLGGVGLAAGTSASLGAQAQRPAPQTRSLTLGDWDKPIDIHVHIEPRSEDFAPLGTVAEFIAQDYPSRVAYMDRYGIAKSVISPGWRYRKAEGIVNTRWMNDMVAGYVAKYPDRFPAGIGIVEVHHGEASLRELERIAKDLKLRGVAWHHVDNGIQINHAFMRPLLKQAQTLKLVPFIHVREKEYEAWWRLDMLLEEFPDLTFVALSGLGTSDDLAQARQIARRRKNVLLDIAPFVHGSESAIESLVKALGAERILFGTNNEATPTLQVVRNSQLSDRDKALVLSGNAQRLLGI